MLKRISEDAVARGLVGAVALALAGVAAAAQDSADPAAGLEAVRTGTGGAKNLTLLGIPSATVAPSGLAFAALAGTTRRSASSDDIDGSAAFGFGLGDANDGVGFQFTTQVISLTDDLGDSGYFTLKAARRVGAGAAPIYAGFTVDRIGTWGDADGRDPRAALALTRFFEIDRGGDRYPVMMTLGAGTDIRDDGTEPGLFAGAGIGLTESIGSSLAWDGREVDLGASFRSPSLANLGLTMTVEDLFDRRDSQRLTLSLTFILPSAFGG